MAAILYEYFPSAEETEEAVGNFTKELKRRNKEMFKKFISAVAAVVLGVMVLTINAVMVTPAAIGTGSVRVPTGLQMVKAENDIDRSLFYSYISVSASAVYPTGNYTEDTYTRCKTRVYHYNSSTIALSDAMVLKEGNGYYNVYLYDNQLGYETIDLYFSGNHADYSAYVNYNYNTR